VGRGRPLTGGNGEPRDAAAVPVDRDPERIAGMFGRIAPRYDVMNRIMTAGLDRAWRRLAAEEAALAPGDRALDVCCGTGDLAFSLAERWPESEVTGLDFTAEMLARARQKAARHEATARGGTAARAPEFVRGDVLSLPYPDGIFAAATVGWGVRNVPDLPRALSEMARVTRPGGRVVCLESTCPPRGFGRLFHRVWFDRLVPALGRVVAGEGGAYDYLPASVRDFPDADRLAELMAQAGLGHVRYRRLGLGAVALHVAVKSAGPEKGTR